VISAAIFAVHPHRIRCNGPGHSPKKTSGELDIHQAEEVGPPRSWRRDGGPDRHESAPGRPLSTSGEINTAQNEVKLDARSSAPINVLRTGLRRATSGEPAELLDVDVDQTPRLGSGIG
jgi:hypothetical protein